MVLLSKMTTPCTCTPGYTCIGSCALSAVNFAEAKHTRCYTCNWEPVAKKVPSPHQRRRMDKNEITVRVAEKAFKAKPCCSSNCMLKMVNKFTIEKVAQAIHTERSRVFHTNQNKAHDEIREILRRGMSTENSRIGTYFFHQGVLAEKDSACPHGILVCTLLVLYISWLYIYCIRPDICLCCRCVRKLSSSCTTYLMKLS